MHGQEKLYARSWCTNKNGRERTLNAVVSYFDFCLIIYSNYQGLFICDIGGTSFTVSIIVEIIRDYLSMAAARGIKKSTIVEIIRDYLSTGKLSQAVDYLQQQKLLGIIYQTALNYKRKSSTIVEIIRDYLSNGSELQKKVIYNSRNYQGLFIKRL